MFDLSVSGFEAVEIEEKEVLVFYFFTDCNMVASGRYGHALDVLDVVYCVRKMYLRA